MSDASLTKQRALNNIIYQYIQDQIWDEPQRESRRAIKPLIVNRKPVAKSISFNNYCITLPDDKELTTQRVPSFYVMYLANSSMSIVSSDFNNSWERLDSVITTKFTEFRIVTPNGIILPRARCYIRKIDIDNGYVIALDALMVQRILGAELNLDQLYVTMYVDSNITLNSEGDRITDLQLVSYFAVNNNAPTLSNDYLYVIDNGIVKLVDNITFQAKRYYEFIKDNDVDLVYSDKISNLLTFNSTYSDVKYILHLPKANNPNSSIYVHNTCDFIIFNLTTGHGLVIPRIFGENSITQLTHQDWGIRKDIIDQLIAKLKVNTSDEFALSVIIRTHGCINTLSRDVNYIYLLYTLEDSQIVRFLAGKDGTNLTFWHADVLEVSNYVKAMLWHEKLYSPDVVKQYIDTLGYFNTVSLLVQRIFTATPITGSTTSTLLFDISLSFIHQYLYGSGTTYKALLYQNGRVVKLDSNSKSYLDNNSVLRLQYNEIEYMSTDKFVIELLPNIELDIVSLALVDNNGTITAANINAEGIPDKTVVLKQGFTYKVFQQQYVTTVAKNHELLLESELVTNPTRTYTYWKEVSFQECFTLISTDEINHTETFELNGDQILTNYQLQSTGYFVDLSPSSFTFEMPRDELNASNSSSNRYPSFTGYVNIAPVQITDTNAYNVLGDIRYLVFLNGKFLVKDVDYTVIRRLDENGYEFGQQLILTNTSYFNENTDIEDNTMPVNEVKVYATSDYVISNSYGFIAGIPDVDADNVDGNTKFNQAFNCRPSDDLGSPANLPLWLNGLSKLYTDGDLADTDGSYLGELLLKNVPCRPGAIYGIDTSIPAEIIRYLSTYHMQDDITRMQLIRDYFMQHYEDPITDLEVIPYSHHIFSIYVSSVIGTLLNDPTAVDLSETGYRNKIIAISKRLEWIKAFDPGILALNNFQRYLDVFPTYCRFKILDKSLYRVVMWFVNRTLTDEIQDKARVHE